MVEQLLNLTEEEVEAKIQSGEMEKLDYPLKLYFLHHDRDVINDELINFIADYLRIYTMREFIDRFYEYIKVAIMVKFEEYSTEAGEQQLDVMYGIIQSSFMITIHTGDNN